MRRVFSYALANPLECGVLLASLALYLLAAPLQSNFADEYDNLLGGVLIWRGLWPNVGFFSHHMPLPYYLAAAMALFVGGNFVAMRVLQLLAMYAMLVAVYGVFKRHIDRRAGLIFVALVSLALPVFWGQMLLAENIISYCAVAVVLLYVYRYSLPGHRWTTGDLALAAVLAAVPALSSQSYAPLSAWLALFLVMLVAQRQRALLPRFVALLAIPYLLVLLPPLVTGNLGRFVFEVYTFNTQYYSQFQTLTRPSGGATLFAFLKELVAGLRTAAYGFSGPQTFLQFLSLVAAISFAALLWAQRGARTAMFALGGILLAAPRGAIGLPWLDNFHGPPYYLLTIAAFAIALVSLGVSPQVGQPLLMALRFALLAYALIVPITLANDALANYRSYFEPAPPDYAPAAAAAINDIAADATAWVAPFDLRLPLRLRARPATRYTFWAPWHAACAACTRELLAELDASRPKVIYWHHGFNMWGHDEADYARPVLDFIEARYARLLVPPEHPLANFYLRADDHADLLARLRQHGDLQGSVDVLVPAQTLHDKSAGDILPDRALRQEVLVEHDGLAELDVLMATYGRQNYGPVVFRLRPLEGPEAGIDLAGATVDASMLKDDSYFRLRAPRPLGKGRYELLIEAPAAMPKNCVTAWTQTGNPYPQGRLTLGGDPIDADLTFRLIYRNT